MGVKRIVDTHFWEDTKIVEMFSPEDKYFFLYLLTNPHTTQLGIYPISRKVMSFELGYTAEAVSVLIDRFEAKYNVIRYSKDTNEIAIKNYLRYSIAKGGKPVEDLLLKEASRVKNRSLLRFVHDSIVNDNNLNLSVFNILSYLNDNDNDNDNENDDSYHESYHESYHDSSTNRPARHKYGEYKNVLLSDEELEKLKTEFADWQARIERLSSYIASTGKSYKNHLATIRNWARADAEKNPKKAASFDTSEFFDAAVRKSYSGGVTGCR